MSPNHPCHPESKSLVLTTKLGAMALLACANLSMADTQIEKNGDSFSIENQFLKRTLSVANGSLMTSEIVNKRLEKSMQPLACDEFSLRISEGTHVEGTDKILTARDFTYKSHSINGNSLNLELANKEHGLDVTVRYELADDESYLRKNLKIKTTKEICVERIDIEAISFKDAYQPYTIKQINANRGGWRPGLGQPLFTTESATFWGVEFPASYNFVKDNEINCGYLYGHILQPGQSINTYKAVVGVGDNAKYNSETFYDYITDIRVRPLRLQLQYNSWFDYRGGVSREKFKASVDKVNKELCVDRGVRPFSAYVIDDGWQDSRGKPDWTQGFVWPTNNKFDKKFDSSFATVKEAKSDLGLWLSPGCNFGARNAVPKMREAGMGGLSNWMSLGNNTYMDQLEERMVELTNMGVTYFKLDGCFGHLVTRDFDIDGAANGIPTMPQLGTKGWRTDDKRLNDAKYDELKSYYLTVGTERMMKIFDKMGDANPFVYIVISNGAYLSPWWMMHCDAVWMINAGDAAGGAKRTDELVYRDNVYHNIWVKEKTHYPMNSLFNHEPKKTQSLESKDTFRKYLYMNMSRGTGFVELYLKTFNLKNYDWDVLAEGLHWVEDVFPTFQRSRMHGGSPTDKQVYGFTGWNKTRGYVSIHNPSEKEQNYSITLDRDFGLIEGTKTYALTSPLADSLVGLNKHYNYGDKIEITLEPREIRILNFDVKAKNWSKLVALQTRTKDDFNEELTFSPKGHAMIGKWAYRAGGNDRLLEFKEDGTCTFIEAGKLMWKKPFIAKSPEMVVSSGKVFGIKTNTTIDVAGLFTATKVE